MKYVIEHILQIIKIFGLILNKPFKLKTTFLINLVSEK